MWGVSFFLIHNGDFLKDIYQKGKNNKTISRKISSIKKFFRFCINKGILNEDPSINIKSPKIDKNLPKVFSKEEIEKLLSLPDTNSKFGVRNRAILEIIYSCGLRISEVANIKISDFDLFYKTLKVIGKGNKKRIIPVGSSAKKFIKRYLKIRKSFGIKQDGKILFLSKSGKKLTSDEIREILKKYILLIAKSSGYSPHTIRHSFATHLLAAGADIVNDISAMQFDPDMVGVIRQYECPVVLMHIQGRPGTMQLNPVYEDVVREVYWYFNERIKFALNSGLAKEQLILDPGIGFGKREEDNYRLMRQLEVFQEFGCPVLLGPSRKSFLKRAGARPEDRLEATSAAVAAAIIKGVQLIRIHDVMAMKRVAMTADLIQNYHS